MKATSSILAPQSFDIHHLLTPAGSVRPDALETFLTNLSHSASPATEQGVAALLASIARLDPDPCVREAVITRPHFPQSALSSCLEDLVPSVRLAALNHPAIKPSAILRHLTYETNDRVIIASLVALHDLSDQQALEALGATDSDAFDDNEFYGVLRQSAEHHSPSVRMASAAPIANLLNSKASAQAFAILEQLVCDIPRVACAAVDAMLTLSHPFRLSERTVRALLSLADARETSALHLLRDVPCKTISGYAFLQFCMERKVYNAADDTAREELDHLFTRIVVRNETFARVLDLSKPLHDKQWLWRGENNKR